MSRDGAGRSLGAYMAKQFQSALIRRKAVEARTGLSRTSIYRNVASGSFPKPVALGDRAVGWVESEIDQWIAARIESRDRAAS